MWWNVVGSLAATVEPFRNIKKYIEILVIQLLCSFHMLLNSWISRIMILKFWYPPFSLPPSLPSFLLSPLLSFLLSLPLSHLPKAKAEFSALRELVAGLD